MSHQRPDPEIPQRRAADPRASAWVAASAGTGKTKVLIDRTLRLLLAGTPPHKLLCLTFTKAAAAEMANRVAMRLADWATADDRALAAEVSRLLGARADDDCLARARRLFAQVLDTPGGMKVQTIHAFCQSLLRRFPLEAGLAPHFQVMDERDAAEMLAAAQEEVLVRARHGADEPLAAALAEVTGHVHEADFPKLMGDLAADRGRLRRFLDANGGLEGAIASVRDRLGVPDGEAPETILAAACSEDAFDGDACRAAAALLREGTKTDGERAAVIAEWLAAGPEARAAGFERYRRAFLTQKEDIRANLVTKNCLDAEPALRAEAERLVAVVERWRAATVAQATAALLRLGDALLAAYESHKAARALLDYDDLILATVRLLSGGRGEAAWVLFKLDGGIDHVMIDEAQDTNPDQWAVVKALTDEFFAGRGAREDVLRTVFAVGDVKQSIYSFQRADPRAFEEMRRRLAQLVPESGRRWEEVPLQVSFRSTRAVLDAVDAVFNRDPGRDGVALAGEEIRHWPVREGQAGLVETWPPVAPRPADEPEPWKPPVERIPADSPRSRLARLVARRIAAMVRDRERLESRDRPIGAGDIMVLVRRRNAFVDDLIRELKGLDVPVAGSDRLVLTEQMAVMDLMALGNALLLPEDDLTLATVLKSPLIGLDEDALFDLAHGRGQRSLWDELKRRPEFAAAHDELASLMALADQMPPHELYAQVLTVRGGRAKLVGRLGWEAEEAIDEFVNLTLVYERAHAPSLQGFLRWLESGSVEIKRDLEQGGGGAVRIMTVHGAKGLQAPVVFLPDTLQSPSQSPRLLWLGERGAEVLLWPPRAEVEDVFCRQGKGAAKAARDQEYRRLLYVAMTRAEDRLYICGWQTRRAAPPDCWYHLVEGAMSAFGTQERDVFLASSHEVEGDTVLRLTCPQEVAAAAEPHAPGRRPETQPPDWLVGPPPAEPSPSRPLMPSRPDGDEPAVRSPMGSDDGYRFRRGRLIHRLLQTLPELPATQRAAAAARFLARPAWNLPAAAQLEIAAETLAVLDDAHFAPIFGPGSQAEVPLIGRLGARVVSGQVDRLLVGPSEVLVVDYKTNRPPPKLEQDVPAAYLRQMAAYRAVLACVYPGRAVRCALLWTDGPRLMTLDSARLDDALAGFAEG
ncbi:MAG: double-strand break repair helicase AddA [Rhodospirillales bacterium]|nr:double-strand break repair helicase AddA [Rhodospirillales bacterium]